MSFSESSSPPFPTDSEAFVASGVSIRQLEALASQVASRCRPGVLLTLDGPLGSGKTTFSQAFAKALGVSETVNSPSFGLINEYTSGQIPIAHADLYRLGPQKAFTFLEQELLPYLDAQTHVVLVEWACYAEDLYAEATFRVHLDYAHQQDEARILTISSAASNLTAPNDAT